MKNRKGFTITELVIVIAVIAILAAVLIPTFSGMIKKANESAVLQEAKNMYTNYIGAVDYAAGETAESTAVIKVVKGTDAYYVKVEGGSMVDEVKLEGELTLLGKTLIEADNTAESGVVWNVITCDQVDGETHDFANGICAKCKATQPANPNP